jgi:hypothetical protein
LERWGRSAIRRVIAVTGAAAVLAVSGVLALPSDQVRATDARPVPVPADASWLTLVNYYRAMAGLGPVVENPIWSQGARLHSCYMLLNGISHDEVPGQPGYSVEGRSAGLSSNVATTSVVNSTARRHVELWMTGPFHAIGILRHNLVQSAYGQCDRADTSPFRSGATLDILRGLEPGRPRPAWPILFPGDGTTTNLQRFETEQPNPLTFCGWPDGGGLPVLAMMPESFAWAVGSITGPDGPLQACTLHPGNTSGLASQILAGENAVVVMARRALAPGRYTVAVTTSARSVSWSFTVDPAVADGVVAPAPNTQATGPRTGFAPIEPRRVVDSRTGLGATRLAPNTPRPIQVAGNAGVPIGASAVSANITAIGGAADGYITVYPCNLPVPLVSTVNFSAGEIVPNAAIVPLDTAGRMCALSNTAVDLLVDVNGAFTSTATGALVSSSLSRLFDTRSGHRAPGRLAAQGVLRVNVKAPGTGVPTTATAVVLNLTAHRASNLGFVTAWPCDRPRPVVSSLNPRAGETRPNMVIVPVPADGAICFFTESEADLFADLAGYVVDDPSGSRFSPLAPARMTDTRDASQSTLNAGLGGAPLRAGSAVQIPMRGVRGVPADAIAVSLNVTTVSASGDGYVTVYPCSAQVPFVSTVNLQPGRIVPNATKIGLSASGSICIYSSHDVHLVVDINGYWS